MDFIYVIYQYSDPISRKTHRVSITNTNQLMLFREIIAVYCENHTKHCQQNAEYFTAILKNAADESGCTV
jgi:hypothetical protein